jgi:hypothetical protein
MKIFALNYRECDDQGCGHYYASRGSRKHMGVDMACLPGTQVGSPVKGQVTKIGWPYAGEPDIRYVQVVAEGYQFRVFYVEPSVAVGDWVELNESIGTSQQLESMTRGGTQHVHFEILDKHGAYIDPTPVVIALRGTLRTGVIL